MKIIAPQITDKQLIYSLYNTATNIDSRSIDYFFSELYNADDFLIYKEDDVVLCCMKAFSENLYLKGYKVEVVVIDNLIISGNCPLAIKDKFIEGCLEYFSKAKLFTITSRPFIENQGFEDVFKHKRYRIYRRDLFNVDGYSISDRFDVYDIYLCYHRFVRHFDSYLDKDLAYFEAKLKRLEQENYEIYVSRNSQNDIVGYIVYNYIDGELEVVKVIYEDTLALLTLLNQAMGMNDHIYVHVSLNENLEKVFGNIHYELKKDVLIRINDLDLFRRLYRVSSKSLTEFLDKNHRPLYLGFY